MKLMLRALVATSILSLAACAQAGPSDVSKAEVEEIVRAYLLENPEVIRDAMIELERRDAEAEVERSRELIADLSDQLFKDPRDFSIGPRDAKVQLVEFFDYNCGFCKRSTGFMENLIEEYPDDVRVVFKEVPVLTGPEGTSHLAARAALAAARQGKYRTLHFALMEQRSLTEDRIFEVAEENGIDVEQLRTDMEDAQIKRQISDNIELGQSIPAFTGTPFFVVNDQYVSGANLVKLDEILQAELSG
ncbi:MAG: DsbA family protein [Litorimonas sp.]